LLLPRPAEVKVVFGNPMEFPEDADYDQISRSIMESIRLLAEG
jgi:hypothetical protein